MLNFRGVHPRKFTWNLKMMVSKRNLLFHQLQLHETKSPNYRATSQTYLHINQQREKNKQECMVETESRFILEPSKKWIKLQVLGTPSSTETILVFVWPLKRLARPPQHFIGFQFLQPWSKTTSPNSSAQFGTPENRGFSKKELSGIFQLLHF